MGLGDCTCVPVALCEHNGNPTHTHACTHSRTHARTHARESLRSSANTLLTNKMYCNLMVSSRAPQLRPRSRVPPWPWAPRTGRPNRTQALRAHRRAHAPSLRRYLRASQGRTRPRGRTRACPCMLEACVQAHPSESIMHGMWSSGIGAPRSDGVPRGHRASGHLEGDGTEEAGGNQR